jgi:formylglycine-generating enzyme required for sulfatase activity
LIRSRVVLPAFGGGAVLAVATGCGTILGFEPLEFLGGEPAGADGATEDGTNGADGGNEGGVVGEAGTRDGAGDAATADVVIGPDGAGCPDGMVGIPRGYCIDSTEVTNGAYKEFLDAIDGGLQIQQGPECAWNTQLDHGTDATMFPTNVDWCDAFAYCKWAGKRLCGRIGGGPMEVLSPQAESQWYNACSHDGDRKYPYAGTFDEARCAVSTKTQRYAAWPVITQTCEGGYDGLFDMSGNVAEWEDQCTPVGTPDQHTCSVRGGASGDTDPERVTCAAPGAVLRSTRNLAIGFRCCWP